MFATVLGAGLALRLVRYLWRDSLWGDEAMLAGSIVSRSFGALVPPLDYGQLAPVPFLWLERGFVAVGGASELAFRAAPLLASCATLVLLAPFAREVLTELETLIALGFTATSTSLIRYSSELKPYALDALAAMLLVWCALRLRRTPEGRAAWGALAATALLTTLVSTPAAFVLAGIAVALGAELLMGGRFGRAGLLAAIAAAGAAVTGMAYLSWYRNAAGNAYIQDFWQAALLRPGTAGLPTRVSVAVEEAIEPGAEWMIALGLSG